MKQAHCRHLFSFGHTSQACVYATITCNPITVHHFQPQTTMNMLVEISKVDKRTDLASQLYTLTLSPVLIILFPSQYCRKAKAQRLWLNGRAHGLHAKGLRFNAQHL